MDTQNTFYPSDEGEVIRISRRRYLGLMLICAAFIGVGIWFITASDTISRRVRWPMGLPWRSMGILILGWIGVVLLGAAPLLLVVRRLLRDRRLWIASDRIQLLEREADVVGQVPYDNIAGVWLVELRGGRFVVLSLLDPERFDTRWPGGKRLCAYRRRWGGYDIAIEPYYREPAQAILDKVLTQYHAFQGK